MAHAVWCARDIIGDEPFALLLPDMLHHGATPCLKDMIEAYGASGGNLIAVAPVPDDQTHQYGIVGVTDAKAKVARITQMVKQTRAVPGYRPMPILFNEDDHENFDQPENNFASAVADHVSWGWFDFRRKGEPLDEGYQSPPVNWGISSARKRAFFDYVAEITGAK